MSNQLIEMMRQVNPVEVARVEEQGKRMRDFIQANKDDLTRCFAVTFEASGETNALATALQCYCAVQFLQKEIAAKDAEIEKLKTANLKLSQTIAMLK